MARLKRITGASAARLRSRLYPTAPRVLAYRRLRRWSFHVAGDAPDSIVGAASTTRIEEVEHALRVRAERRKPGRRRYVQPERRVRARPVRAKVKSR